ncbi:Nuclear transcription factor Y subunit C-3 [Apostasia shenzhenica]|uniref:Nuclear transcription factor Y subunit C-3 n=1 Tax=Apostasia shenzhenica TaxID=1088818 RepID=A0A2I0A9D1_9ASPA|nr:Nuclear transcription factor Y subunit C-3 [Apostasia shenzhenica]
MRQAGIYSGILSHRTGPHSLPLSRIKKIMRHSGSDSKAMMIAGEAPLVFSKACEIFIQELTARAYEITVLGRRRTLQKDDIATAITVTDLFDFLLQVVPESADAGDGAAPAAGGRPIDDACELLL